MTLVLLLLSGRQCLLHQFVDKFVRYKVSSQGNRNLLGMSQSHPSKSGSSSFPYDCFSRVTKLTYWAQEPANRCVFSPPMIRITISTRQAETPLLLVKMVCKVVSMSFSFSIFASYLSGKRQPSSLSKSELGTFLLPEILPDLRPGIVGSSPKNWDCGRESIICHVEASLEM